MPLSGLSAGTPGYNRLSSSTNDSVNGSLDWRKIEESLQDENTTSISEALANIKMSDAQGKASETLLLTSIEKLNNDNIVIRSGAMVVLSHAVLTDNKDLTPHITTLARALGQPSLLDLKAGRDMPEYGTLHKNFCALINDLQFKEPDKILPNFKPLAAYLVQCTGHENQEIATTACEYWARLPLPPVPERHLEHWLPFVLAQLGKLVPNLLKSLIYHAEHIEFLQTKQNTVSGRETPTQMEQYTNRRNYAAMGLENIGRIFANETVNAMKPLIQKWLYSKDWWETEAMILALGAITQALGVIHNLKDLYPTIIPRMYECFTHSQPLVRSITCFTMQLFITMEPRTLGVKDPFAKVLRFVLELLHDKNEEVQQMAAQCLSTMLAYSTKDITPYHRKLIDELIRADTAMSGQARFTYYECIAHLFGRLSAHMESDDIKALMAPFLNHWNMLDVNEASSASKDPGQDTLLLCQPLCTVVMYGRYHLEPYNEEIMSKIVSYLSSVSNKQNLAEELTTQRTVAYLDLASAMLEGQGHNLSSILSKLEVTPCVVKILQNSKIDNAVHQSSIALIGNLCKHCYSLIHPHIDVILPILQKDMASQLTEIRNNAIWALFSFIKNCPDCLSAYDAIGEDLATLLRKQEANEGIMINATLALTSLSAKWPDKFATLVTTDTSFNMICNILQYPFPRDLEKLTLYQNLCVSIANHFNNISVTGWVQFCIAAAILESPDDALRLKMKTTLHNARSAMGNKNWAKVTQQISSQLASTLRRRYRLY